MQKLRFGVTTKRISLSHLVKQVRLFVLGLTFIICATLIVANTAIVPTAGLALSVGQVTPNDILAPISIAYESAALTRLARLAAADAVGKIYDPPNPAILRQQVQTARNALDYIANVRADSYGTRDQRVADLDAISVLNLPSETYSELLDLTDDAWKDVDAQIMGLLERSMRSEIREDRLQDVYDTLPNLVSFTMTETQSTVIVAIVRMLIRPNVFYNEERTRGARDDAALAVQPVIRSFAQGQVVIRAGTVISDADIEALARLKLLQPTDQQARIFVGAGVAVLLITLLMMIYISRYRPSVLHESSTMIVIGALFLLFLAGARLFQTADPFLSHLYPAATFALILVAVTGPHIAIAATAGLAALIGISAGSSFEVALTVGAGGVAGMLAMRQAERLNTYFAAGLAVGAVNMTITALFGLISNNLEPAAFLAALGASLLNGLLSAGLGLVGLYLVSNVLNVPTSVKLIELSQPNQPILQRLLREAPGTYQHSLQVANLAEMAAERIGANAALVRIAAMYHDLGKLHAPMFFGENQAEGVNAHEELTYEESARVIIAHVTEGEKMARKARLPNAIIDFIMQHHGTTQVLYFYNKALEAAGLDETKVDKNKFTYPGPRPQTRESGLMMLADTSESVVRSHRTRDKQEIADIVRDIIQTRLNSGQLDESGLTINDIKTIQDVFVSSLQGIFHPRIAYPSTPRLVITQDMRPVSAQMSSASSADKPVAALPASLIDPLARPPTAMIGASTDADTKSESQDALQESGTPKPDEPKPGDSVSPVEPIEHEVTDETGE